MVAGGLLAFLFVLWIAFAQIVDLGARPAEEPELNCVWRGEELVCVEENK
jgi:hypothetical protein